MIPASRRSIRSRPWLLAAILLASLGSQGHIGSPELAKRAVLEMRALRMLAKAEDTRALISAQHSAARDALCETVRDTAIALGRPEVVERALPLHSRPCEHLLEAQVVLAARRASRACLAHALAALNVDIACLHGEKLAAQAAAHGSSEFALAVCDRIENLTEETSDQKKKRRLRNELLAALRTVARTGRADAALRARTLSVMERWGDGLLVDCLDLLDSDMLAQLAAGEEYVTRPYEQSEGGATEEGLLATLRFGELFHFVYGRPVFDSRNLAAVEMGCRAKLEHARDFLLAVAAVAERCSSPIVRHRLRCAVGGALLRLGAVAEALPLIAQCFTDLGPGSPPSEVIDGLDCLLEDIKVAAARGAFDQQVLEAFAAQAGAFPPGLRAPYLAAIAHAMLRSESIGRAMVVIDRIQQDMRVANVPGQLQGALTELCYALSRSREPRRAQHLQMALNLARSIVDLEDESAVTILSVVPSLLQAGRLQEAAVLVDEMVPLYQIPVGEAAPQLHWEDGFLEIPPACYTSSCNVLAVQLASEGRHQEALDWLHKGARVAVVRDPNAEGDLPLHDDREAVMRAFIAAWRVSKNTLYLGAAITMARRLSASDPLMEAGWIAILALVSTEFGDKQHALGLLHAEARAVVQRPLDAYHKVVTLLTFADAFYLLGFQPEAQRLIAQCLNIARADEALRRKRWARREYEGDDVSCFPPIARTLVWQGERLGDIELMRQGAALMLGDAWADGYWDCAPLAVRLAQGAVKFHSDALLASAMALVKRMYFPLADFALPRDRRQDIMLVGGRSGELGIIDQCEWLADLEPDPYRRTKLYASLVRGILEHGRVRAGWEEKDLSLVMARAWLELWEVRVVHGRYEFRVPLF